MSKHNKERIKEQRLKAKIKELEDENEYYRTLLTNNQIKLD